ncbi:MAG: T9SS type A sorting domain-containing protein [Lewinellaceae bacterium]|nr:T9SS type A sorting domain-containing protein [Lewinellaceae bacterium]
MRKAILLLLSCSIMIQLIAQPSNDNCSAAQNLELKTPLPCPEIDTLSDNFQYDNIGATPSMPFPALSGCSGYAPESAADVWFQFSPMGNHITISLDGELESPFVALFENGQEGCSGIYPVACASGTGSLELSTVVDPNSNYYLLVSGGDEEDQGSFNLSIATTNDCGPCTLGRQGFFTVSPAPENGTYSSGQTVQMCYVVSRWDASTSGEYLHGLELDLGPGWDAGTLVSSPPPSCSSEGAWAYYQEWTSAATGQSYGPGFAFDGQTLDGNPGNNRGLSGSNCADIGITAPLISFCWSITAADCIPGDNTQEHGLNVSVRMLGDGVSGSGMTALCDDGRPDNFFATLYCPDPLAPDIDIVDASCGDDCDGALIITGGGEGPWDYAVVDAQGNNYYSSTSSIGADTVPELCPGDYTIYVYSVSTGESRIVTVTVGTTGVPQASATYHLPCIEGEPIELYGQASPSAGAVYSWTGPNGFSSTKRDPLALYSGTYTLAVSVNGCPSAPFVLEVPPIGQTVVEITEDTLIGCPGEPVTITAGGNATSFTWYASNSNIPVGAGPSITVSPEDGAIYRVTAFNDNGCSGFDEVVIRIPFGPVIQADTSGTLCPGTSVTLTASEGEQFLWSTGDTTASITVTPEQSSIYYLDVKGPNGCIVQLSAAVSIASSVGIFISPDAALCEGESVNLFANGGEISWSTGDSVSAISVSPLQTTTYSATITNSLGCVFVKETTVTVSPAPNIELVPADTSYICQGDSLQLQAFEADSLIWGSVVAPAQSRDYILPGAAYYGCREIGRFTVVVNPLPTLSIDGQQLLCSSDSLLLVANSNGTLLWSTGEDNDSIYVLPAGTQTYSVTATNTSGCSRTDSVEVTQASPPDAPQVNCTSSLGKVVFSWVVEPGLTYGLSHLQGPAGTPIGNNQYAITGLFPGQTVSIELEATNADGCTAVTPASCSASDCSVISLLLAAPGRVCSISGPVPLAAFVTGGSGSGIGGWSGTGVNDATDTFHPDIAGGGTHDLIYTYTDAGCTVRDTIQIFVEQTLEATMIECEASPTDVVFFWPAFPQDLGYEVVVSSGQSGQFINTTTYKVDGLGIGEQVTIEVTVLSDGTCGETTVSASCTTTGCPSLEAIPDTMICAGEKALLMVDPEGWDTFQWTPAAGLSCTDCPETYASPSATTTYTLVASTADGCTDTLQTTVYVGQIPDAYISDDPIVFCEGQPLEICLPDVGIMYWVGPDAFVSIGQCLSFDNPTQDIAGPYFVLLRTEACRFTKRFELVPAPPIEVLDISSFQATCPDEPFTLYVESPDAVSYAWSPSQYLDCPTCPITEGRVPQTASFTVEMTDAYGCTATESAVVFVDDCQPRPAQPPVSPVGTETLRFYPNPASHSVQLELPGDGPKAIQLWSGSGKLLREYQTSEQAFTLPLHSVPGGAYLLRMVSGQEARTGWLVVEE